MTLAEVTVLTAVTEASKEIRAIPPVTKAVTATQGEAVTTAEILAEIAEALILAEIHAVAMSNLLTEAVKVNKPRLGQTLLRAQCAKAVISLQLMQKIIIQRHKPILLEMTLPVVRWLPITTVTDLP